MKPLVRLFKLIVMVMSECWWLDIYYDCRIVYRFGRIGCGSGDRRTNFLLDLFSLVGFLEHHAWKAESRVTRGCWFSRQFPIVSFFTNDKVRVSLVRRRPPKPAAGGAINDIVDILRVVVKRLD